MKKLMIAAAAIVCAAAIANAASITWTGMSVPYKTDKETIISGLPNEGWDVVLVCLGATESWDGVGVDDIRGAAGTFSSKEKSGKMTYTIGNNYTLDGAKDVSGYYYAIAISDGKTVQELKDLDGNSLSGNHYQLAWDGSATQQIAAFEYASKSDTSVIGAVPEPTSALLLLLGVAGLALRRKQA